MSERQQARGNAGVAPVRHVHLIGICGSAMASLAGMLQLQGWRVSGSDKAAYPPMSDLLDSFIFRLRSRFRKRIWSRVRISSLLAMQFRAAIRNWNMCSISAFLSVRWRS